MVHVSLLLYMLLVLVYHSLPPPPPEFCFLRLLALLLRFSLLSGIIRGVFFAYVSIAICVCLLIIFLKYYLMHVFFSSAKAKALVKEGTFFGIGFFLPLVHWI